MPGLSKVERWSTNNLSSINTQKAELRTLLVANGTTGATLVGHSMGGLVGRAVGQERPDLIAGVVSIDTPHHGALVADFTPQFVFDFVAGWVGLSLNQRCDQISLSEDPGAWISCSLLVQATGVVGQLGIPSIVDRYVGAVGDLSIASSSISQLNGGYEPFQRASVRNAIATDFAIFHLAEDQFDIAWDPYFIAALSMTNELVGSQLIANGYWFAAIPLLAVAISMNVVDIIWNLISGAWLGEGPGDGIVSFASQAFPNAPGAHAPQNQFYNIDEQWCTPFANSHVGNTTFGQTWDQARAALISQGVQARIP